ncbi:MAG: twin-arginine translocase TatA/TatE family subunit [Candidatus Latescibacterota bacterium]|jgi:sec-independent protein translocase protein TatA|nr:twin-arginine translocase TatA/TatE family subunit [Gemmatimonadota bacterium]MDP7363362.1 twin-arginine translocase TatA/TatE family subunit [Candidatus Latescibacterota bacterium]MDP7634006.1 twin-arginine translocase TatA/TatE family subunit [Candidatus Latescibacterota bacterium]MEC8930432.1 twin-arginine translocase TatA/TatE family subunit [Candidatus Latescibacterota bacterium]MEC9378162.1 twin-arginine translocase TatA/TatE family subunit [Candidatus Latescibacterota bacterium]|tara:strand:+ start:1517 stop:1828 length:312 start_codon:yes stop_codon:yes gene_type:complete
MPGHWEILVIFLVVLLLFGARRIPEMAQGLGKGIREFRKAVKDVQEEVDVSGTINPQSAQTIPPPAGQVPRQDAAPPQQPAAPPQQPTAAAPTETESGGEARS